MESRIDRLRRRMDEAGVDTLLVSSRPNVRYLSGFSGSSGALLVRRSATLLFTDSRYTLQAAGETSGVEVATVAGSPLAAAVDAAAPEEKLGFEAAHLSFADHRALAGRARCAAFLPTRGLVESLRVVKEPEEVGLIESSLEINSGAFEAGIQALASGATELEVAASIEHAMKRSGASAPSFESIVASGPRGALPHARPGSRRPGPGEAVVVDIGAMVRGYASDMTRTVFVKEAGRRGEEIYGAVLASVEAAREQVRPGRPASAVDEAARKVLADMGFGEEAFRHGTGHGVGLEVHEAPRISPESEEPLESGMVFTIEPGIYVEGWGGVRIEDVVVVESDGCRVLTSTSKEILTV